MPENRSTAFTRMAYEILRILRLGWTAFFPVHIVYLLNKLDFEFENKELWSWGLFYIILFFILSYFAHSMISDLADFKNKKTDKIYKIIYTPFHFISKDFSKLVFLSPLIIFIIILINPNTEINKISVYNFILPIILWYCSFILHSIKYKLRSFKNVKILSPLFQKLNVGTEGAEDKNIKSSFKIDNIKIPFLKLNSPDEQKLYILLKWLFTRIVFCWLFNHFFLSMSLTILKGEFNYYLLISILLVFLILHIYQYPNTSYALKGAIDDYKRPVSKSD